MPEELNVLKGQTGYGLADPSVAPVVRHLLESVGQTLSPDQASAKRLIDQALALLRQDPANAALRPGVRDGSGGLAPWQVRRVCEFVEQNLGSSLPMAKLAELVGLNRFYFCHAFKKSLGMSPHAYVMRKRLEKVQGLMLATDEPLIRIALNCGLASQSHLCQVFRRATGCSPAAWRRMHRTGHTGER